MAKKLGRPTKLTPETKRRLLALLGTGCTRRDACLASGVPVRTFMCWLERGVKEREAGRSTLFTEFLAETEQAEAEARAKLTAVIVKAAADGDWRAALEYLKRRDREHWGDNVDVTSGGEKVAPRVELVEVIKLVRDE